MKWNSSFVDGQLLTKHIDSIEYEGKLYNIAIEVSKYKKLIDETFDELSTLGNHDDNQDILSSVKDGKISHQHAKWVRGTNPALHYRGNALKRHKVWFQQYDEGYYAYKYTGWQKAVLEATFSIDSKRFPKTTACVERMKKDCDQNHWIVTKYEDGNDYIGMHSDKTHTWVKNSYFQVIKWGYPRIFEVALKDNKKVKDCTVIFRKILPAGTSIIVNMETNELTRHGVPVMKDTNVKVSGSIVGRHIATCHSVEECKKMVKQAKRDKLKRKIEKEERKKLKKLKMK
jgi:hypothetical protein